MMQSNYLLGAFTRLIPKTTPRPNIRCFSSHKKTSRQQVDLVLYISSAVLFTLGLSYASVPLYRILCSRTGFDGTPSTEITKYFDPKTMKPIEDAKKIKIEFKSAVSPGLGWEFKPIQGHVLVVPGETVLAFYHAKNTSNEDLTGVSTYSIAPAKAAQYFNKIQCFCFEDQKLLASEEVDMPVFFYIDPEFARDPRMADVNNIVLHYMFFKSKYSGT